MRFQKGTGTENKECGGLFLYSIAKHVHEIVAKMQHNDGMQV